MKATRLLRKQHRKAEGSLKKLCHRHDRDVLEELADELAAHMVIEETIFYPAVRQVKPELVLESYEEHAIAQLALKRLLATPGSDPRFIARATALKDLLDRHVEEEESDLFPSVEKHIAVDQLDTLGDKLEMQFDTLVARGHKVVLPHGPATVTADRPSERVAHHDGYGTHRGLFHH
jgi:iron-sulfur cluster repair protein YtfE (RIC family)